MLRLPTIDRPSFGEGTAPPSGRQSVSCDPRSPYRRPVELRRGDRAFTRPTVGLVRSSVSLPSAGRETELSATWRCLGLGLLRLVRCSGSRPSSVRAPSFAEGTALPSGRQSISFYPRCPVRAPRSALHDACCPGLGLRLVRSSVSLPSVGRPSLGAGTTALSLRRQTAGPARRV